MELHIYADAEQGQHIKALIDMWQYDTRTVITHKLDDFSPDNHSEGDYVVVSQLKVARRHFGENVSDCSFVQRDGVSYFLCHSFSYGQYNEGWFTMMAHKLYRYHLLAVAGSIMHRDTIYEIVDSSNIRPYIQEIKERGIIAFDTETTGLHPYTQPDFRIRVLTFSYKEGHACVILLEPYEPGTYNIPMLDDIGMVLDQKQLEAMCRSVEAVDILSKEVFLNPEVVKVGHHVKFDMHVLNTIDYGRFAGPIYDTMVIAHMLHQAEKRPYGLKPLTADYIPSMREWSSGIVAVHQAPLESLIPYSATDPDSTLRLFHYFLSTLLQTEAYIHLLRSLICPTLYTLYDMERNGALVDNTYRMEMVKAADAYLAEREDLMRSCPDFVRYDVKRRRAAKEAKIQELLAIKEDKEAKNKHLRKDGKEAVAYTKLNAEISRVMSGDVDVAPPFNFDSPEQLGDFFYESEYGLKLPMPWVRGTGKEESGYKPSTKSEYLMLIADKSEVVGHLQAHREMSKIKSSYLTGFQEFIDPFNRIHASYGQHTVETGRLSCKSPNLQTMPRGSSVGAPDTNEINDAAKTMFIAPEGYDIVQIDFKALELRIMAHFSQDPGMLKVFSDGLDPHTTTAKALSKLTDEEWDALPDKKRKALRNKGKATNFLLIYQGSVAGFRYASRVAYGVEMSEEEAQESYDMFFKAYPGIHAFHQRQIKQAKNHKFCETLLGRQRTLAYYMNSHESSMQQHGIRQAINTPCQGAGAEATQFMHVLLYRLLAKEMPGEYQFFNQVHDSIMLYVKEGSVGKFYKCAKAVVGELKEKLADHFHGRTFENVDLDIDMEHGKTWKSLEAYQEEVL